MQGAGGWDERKLKVLQLLFFIPQRDCFLFLNGISLELPYKDSLWLE